MANLSWEVILIISVGVLVIVAFLLLYFWSRQPSSSHDRHRRDQQEHSPSRPVYFGAIGWFQRYERERNDKIRSPTVELL